MKQFFTLLLFSFLTFSISAATVYETGNNTGDDWSGWSTPVTTNCTASFTGVNHYKFSGSFGDTYSFETYREFTVQSNDIDLYLDVLGQDCTVEVEISTDNVTYTNLHTENLGSGYAITNIIEPTIDPGNTTFYLKLIVNGTFGSPSNTSLYYMKMDAVLSASVDELAMGSNMFFQDKQLKINTAIPEYIVEIYNINGQKLAEQNNLTTHDFSSYENGIYFVSVVDKVGRRKTVKVINQ